MNSSSFSSISLSLIHKRRRFNNAAVEGAGAAAVEGAGAATAAAAGALVAVEDWKLKLQRSLARRVWESPLMKEHRAVFDRLFAAELRHAEALKDLRLTTVSLAGLSIATFIICVSFLLKRVEATEGGLNWTRLGGTVALIASMVLFSFLSRRR